MKILNNVNYPEDVRKLSLKEKEVLAKELREKIINLVSKTGGHLASNLGVVELTIALHSVFNTPMDKIIWDVGHQTYVHKMLTGRKQKLESLRKLDGISGFPKTNESIYDNFNTGHSSTSISIGLGFARVRDIKKENHKIVAVIGDGALTGGMALEALNDLGSSETDMLVVLNDNEMSISKNVGGISLMLSKIRTQNLYVNTNIKGKRKISKIPFVGKKIVKLVQKTKRSIKQFVIPKMYFEDIGFRYLGPVDGHNIEELENMMELARKQSGPILLHVITKKGKGYEHAEKNPDKFHGISKFDVETGEKIGKSKKDYSSVFGSKLCRIAENNSKVVAITAAMKDGTGLKEFAEKYPERFFDVGIAEQHAIGLAAGIAKAGMIPVVPIYSSFLQRAYDQMVHDVSIQNLPVVICADRAGIVGNDGETHQGLLDVAFTKTIPNFTIMAPKDFNELEEMLDFAVELQSPVLIRYPRGGEDIDFKVSDVIKNGRIEVLNEGEDIAFIAIGKMVSRAKKIVDSLAEIGVNAKLINARFLKPIDEEYLIENLENIKRIITIEDCTVVGGLGEEIEKIMFRNKLDIDVVKFAYPDTFVKQGDVTEIEERFGMDKDNIERLVYSMYEVENKNNNIIDVIKRGSKCLKVMEEKMKKKKLNY